MLDADWPYEMVKGSDRRAPKHDSELKKKSAEKNGIDLRCNELGSFSLIQRELSFQTDMAAISEVSRTHFKALEFQREPNQVTFETDDGEEKYFHGGDHGDHLDAVSQASQIDRDDVSFIRWDMAIVFPSRDTIKGIKRSKKKYGVVFAFLIILWVFPYRRFFLAAWRRTLRDA